MVEKDKIIEEKLVYTGIGDFRGSYEHAFDWLKTRGWSVTEEKYAEKLKGEVRDVEIEWACTSKFTDYFKGSIKVRWMFENMKEVEVEIDGKRKKMQEFRAEIKFKGVLEKDYKSRWEGSATQKFMKDVYHKFVIPGRIDEKEDQVANDVVGLKEELKAFFDLVGRR